MRYFLIRNFVLYIVLLILGIIYMNNFNYSVIVGKKKC